MTSGVSQPTNPGSASRGYAWVPVIVQSVDGNTATVIDSTTQTRQISIAHMAAKGFPPKPGEQWLIHRQYGAWTFGLCLNTPTTITFDDIPGLSALSSDVDILQTQVALLNSEMTRSALNFIVYGTSAVGYVVLANSITTLTTATAGVYQNLTDTSASHLLCGLNFNAPPSGIMKLCFGGNFRANTTGTTLQIGLQVNTGAIVGGGANVSGIADFETIKTSAIGSVVPGSRVRYLVGLTPGNPYNAFIKWTTNSAGATGDCTNPFVECVPRAQ